MRVLSTLFLAAGLLASPSQADEGSCTAQKSACSSESAVEFEVANSCRHMCPVANDATALGRKVVLEVAVALVDRSELEA